MFLTWAQRQPGQPPEVSSNNCAQKPVPVSPAWTPWGHLLHIETGLNNPVGGATDLGSEEEACVSTIRTQPRNGPTSSALLVQEGRRWSALQTPTPTLAISRLAPCSAPKRPLNGPTRDLHPSRWWPHPFPGDSGLGFRMGCLQAQTNPNMVPLHSAIFPQSMRIPGKLGWSGGKPGSGVTGWRPGQLGHLSSSRLSLLTC